MEYLLTIKFLDEISLDLVRNERTGQGVKELFECRRDRMNVDGQAADGKVRICGIREEEYETKCKQPRKKNIFMYEIKIIGENQTFILHQERPLLDCGGM